MKIEFVNHASTIFTHDGISLITDPWLEGNVFHNGWSLLSPTRFTYQDYSRITHIWFSHEHPDHFFPPNIKAIPADIRKNITVLYHLTEDKKVVEFCQKLGFKAVIEVEPNKELELAPDFKIINTPFDHDSWLCIKTRELTCLNTNDCVINTTAQAESVYKVTGKIDVFLTQFSYASKHGNANEPQKRIKAAEDKFRQMKVQFEVFKPTWFIPIASFIWYSHEENFYMNDHVNTIDKVEQYVLSFGIVPVVLYPGDTWTAGEKHNNVPAIERYMGDLKNISYERTTRTVPVTLDALKESAGKLRQQLKNEDRFSKFLLSFYPLTVYMPDLQKAVKFSSRSGLKEVDTKREEANVVMTSEVLDYCLRFNWGFGATQVNGRYEIPSARDSKIFYHYVAVADALNHKDSSFKRVMAKVKRKLGMGG